jgi:hypothetical protein
MAVIGCSLGILWVGCMVSSEQTARLPDQSVQVEDLSKARIYLIRQQRWTDKGPMALSDTGLPIGTMSDGGYLSWERAPGSMTLDVRFISLHTTLTLNVEAGKVYYFVAQTVGTAFDLGAPTLKRVDRRVAQPLIDQAPAPIL